MTLQKTINSLNNKMSCTDIVNKFSHKKVCKNIQTVKQFRDLLVPAYVKQYGSSYTKPKHLINEINKLNKRLPKIFFFLAKHYDAFSKSGWGLTFRNKPGVKHFEGLAGGFPRANRLIKLMKLLGIIKLKLKYKAKLYSNVYVSGNFHIKGKLWTSPKKLYHAQKQFGQNTSNWVKAMFEKEPSEAMRQKLEPLYKQNAWSFCYLEDREAAVEKLDRLMVRRSNYRKIQKLNLQTKSLHLINIKDKPLWRAGFFLKDGEREVFLYDEKVTLYGKTVKLSDPVIKPDLINIITQAGKGAIAGKLDITLTSSYYYQKVIMKYFEQRDPLAADDRTDYAESGKTIEEEKEEQRIKERMEFFKDEIEKEEKEFEERLARWDEFFGDD